MALRPFISLGCALLSSVLLTLAFPLGNQGWLAWVALLPLLLAIREVSPASAALLGFVSGFAASAGINHWIGTIPAFSPIHIAMLSAYLALYSAAWCAGIAWWRNSIPLGLLAPALWVIVEYLRANAGFLAFPWATLAHSQHENFAVLQLASITGEQGISFLVVLANTMLYGLWHAKWRPALAPAALIALVHAHGAWRIAHPPEVATMNAVVVQPGISVEERDSAEGRLAAHARLDQITRAATGSADLFVWPETAIPHKVTDPQFFARAKDLVDQTGVPLLTGAAEMLKFREEGPEIKFQSRLYNSAYLLLPQESEPEPYRKIILVPFGEYLPMAGLVRWPAWFAPRQMNVIAGNRRGIFELPDGTRIATVICWENLFSEFVRDAAGDDAQVLAHLSNTVWLGDGAGPRQHNLASVLRAVENGISVVVANNTGPSEVIDPHGRVLSSIPVPGSVGAITADVPLREGRTLFNRIGNAFPLACLLVLLGAMAKRLLKTAKSH